MNLDRPVLHVLARAVPAGEPAAAATDQDMANPYLPPLQRRRRSTDPRPSGHGQRRVRRGLAGMRLLPRDRLAMSAPTTHRTAEPKQFTHVCMDCGALGYAGSYHDHGNGNAGDTIALADLPELVRDMQRFESETYELQAEVKRLAKELDEAARQLALTVRWGTGVNLQASAARGFLERRGYVLDDKGWLDDEAGFQG